MLWTILAALGVIAVRALTVYRLREMKAGYEAKKPELEALQRKVLKAEKANKTHVQEVESQNERLGHLKDVIRNLEITIRRPAVDKGPNERTQVAEELEE
jgi:hypothetical protein